ncbi:MAG: hypothetical protein LIO76_10410 [Clostridiales bacterium]|nr:hypothetical protein [Clostridiales bacterium]
MDFSWLKGKKVLVIDDSLNEGTRLFYFYVYLKNRMEGTGTVIPVVYNLNADYVGQGSTNKRFGLYKTIFRDRTLSDDTLMPGFQTEQEAFNQDLVYGIRVGANRINSFSIALTNMFQENLCPLVMNLPMLRFTADSQDLSQRFISITWEQFEKLKKGCGKWKYTEIHYNEKDIKVHFGFFQMRDEWLLQKTENYISDLVVKCKYNIMKDGSVHVVFVPFAIVKSMTMLDVFRYFCSLFAGTSYFCETEKEVLKIYQELCPDGPSYESMDQMPDEIALKVMKYETVLCLKLYRSVIFEISDFINMHFKNFVKSQIGISLEEDWQIMEENFEESFIESVRARHLDSSVNEMRNDDTTPEWARMGEQIMLVIPQWLDDENPDDRRYGTKPEVSEQGVYLCFHDLVQEHKQNTENSNISFEEVENRLSVTFAFVSETQKRTYTSGILLMMLEESCVGNDIQVSLEYETVIREVRPGENSDLYLGENMVYFYSYMYALSMKYQDEELEEKARSYLDRMQYYFGEKNYFGLLMSEDEFFFYKRYFSRFIGTGNLRKHIENKQLLLDDYFNSPRGQGDRYIGEAFNNIRQWSM